MLSAQSFKFLGITLCSGSGEASFPGSRLRSQRGSVRPSHQRLGPSIHPRVSELARHRWRGGVRPMPGTRLEGTQVEGTGGLGRGPWPGERCPRVAPHESLRPVSSGALW